MARPILSGFGPDSSQPQAPTADCGGILPGYTSDVMGYQPPYGPKGINDAQGPGIHGRNSGNANRPTATSEDRKSTRLNSSH